MSKIGILILNYKNYQDTSGCIESILDSDLPKNAQIYILDNSNSPHKLKQLGDRYKKITTIDNGGNFGFAGGNNPGIIRAIYDGMDLILIMNPDVRVGRDFFGRMIKAIDSDSEIGIVAPALEHKQKNKVMYGLEGYIDWNFMKASHRNTKKKLNKELILSEFVTFACVLIKKSVFEKVGLLDTRFFMYLEDVDFCIRASRAGFKIALQPSTVCSHKTSGSFDDPRKKLPISFVSQIKFCDKYLTGYKKIVAVLYYCLFYPYLYMLWTWHKYKAKGL